MAMEKDNQGREDRAMAADIRMMGKALVPKDRGKCREEYLVVMKVVVEEEEDVRVSVVRVVVEEKDVRVSVARVVVEEKDVRVRVVRVVAVDISPVREIILLLPSSP
ncbi:hypothetical protein I3843_02G050600 [Carya illinoinensis]|uniref:Uncharacterized protein n=1 Tax=Carya illinoinensis TaxID=32201 RepID=A0A922FV39_CARIL|nr:hypothetical protein I3842_02G062800 [Carya illinoinensis]KAG7990948.1 hypothetical protein I3843_02G050600 [Carya illinoinensis]